MAKEGYRKRLNGFFKKRKKDRKICKERRSETSRQPVDALKRSETNNRDNFFQYSKEVVNDDDDADDLGSLLYFRDVDDDAILTVERMLKKRIHRIEKKKRIQNSAKRSWTRPLPHYYTSEKELEEHWKAMQQKREEREKEEERENFYIDSLISIVDPEEVDWESSNRRVGRYRGGFHLSDYYCPAYFEEEEEERENGLTDANLQGRERGKENVLAYIKENQDPSPSSLSSSYSYYYYSSTLVEEGEEEEEGKHANGEEGASISPTAESCNSFVLSVCSEESLFCFPVFERVEKKANDPPTTTTTSVQWAHSFSGLPSRLTKEASPADGSSLPSFGASSLLRTPPPLPRPYSFTHLGEYRTLEYPMEYRIVPVHHLLDVPSPPNTTGTIQRKLWLKKRRKPHHPVKGNAAKQKQNKNKKKGRGNTMQAVRIDGKDIVFMDGVNGENKIIAEALLFAKRDKKRKREKEKYYAKKRIAIWKTLSQGAASEYRLVKATPSSLAGGAQRRNPTSGGQSQAQLYCGSEDSLSSMAIHNPTHPPPPSFMNMNNHHHNNNNNSNPNSVEQSSYSNGMISFLPTFKKHSSYRSIKRDDLNSKSERFTRDTSISFLMSHQTNSQGEAATPPPNNTNNNNTNNNNNNNNNNGTPTTHHNEEEDIESGDLNRMRYNNLYNYQTGNTNTNSGSPLSSALSPLPKPPAGSIYIPTSLSTFYNANTNNNNNNNNNNNSNNNNNNPKNSGAQARGGSSYLRTPVRWTQQVAPWLDGGGSPPGSGGGDIPHPSNNNNNNNDNKRRGIAHPRGRSFDTTFSVSISKELYKQQQQHSRQKSGGESNSFLSAAIPVSSGGGSKHSNSFLNISASVVGGTPDRKRKDSQSVPPPPTINLLSPGQALHVTGGSRTPVSFYLQQHHNTYNNHTNNNNASFERSSVSSLMPYLRMGKEEETDDVGGTTPDRGSGPPRGTPSDSSNLKPPPRPDPSLEPSLLSSPLLFATQPPPPKPGSVDPHSTDLPQSTPAEPLPFLNLNEWVGEDGQALSFNTPSWREAMASLPVDNSMTRFPTNHSAAPPPHKPFLKRRVEITNETLFSTATSTYPTEVEETLLSLCNDTHTSGGNINDDDDRDDGDDSQ